MALGGTHRPPALGTLNPHQKGWAAKQHHLLGLEGKQQGQRGPTPRESVRPLTPTVLVSFPKTT